jgi:hypothetical protein
MSLYLTDYVKDRFPADEPTNFGPAIVRFLGWVRDPAVHP